MDPREEVELSFLELSGLTTLPLSSGGRDSIGRKGQSRARTLRDRLGGPLHPVAQSNRLAFWGYVLFCSSHSPIFSHLFSNVLLKHFGQI